MPFDNDLSLTQALVADFGIMINDVADEVWMNLNEEIQYDVYDVYTPKSYDRLGVNGGLLNEFDKTHPSITGNTITSEIGDNPDRLTLDPDNFIHGSNYWSTEDIRDLLIEIITQGKSGPLFGQGPWRAPRDFWTPFIQKLDNGFVFDLIEKAMTSRGLVWIRI